MKKYLFFMFILILNLFSQDFKTDKNLVSGTLKNGLKYYIYPNKKPQNFISARIEVKTGSLNEEKNEEGLAHFIEHMAFNGTKKYPKNDLIKILESKGVGFGNDLNAYTSFDKTVYMLDGQTKDLNDFLDILHEWAFNVTFDKNETEKEKGVVIEEWRRNTGLNKEIQDFYQKYLFSNSRYLERLPIGLVPSIENFTREGALKYYKKWYVPNNMIIYVAGDIKKPQETIKKIENLFGNEKFSKLPNNEKFKTKKITNNDIFDIYQNDQAKFNSFTYLNMIPNVLPKNDLDKIKKEQISGLFNTIIHIRYAEKLNSLDTNIKDISISENYLNDYFGFQELSIELKNDKEIEGIEEAFKEFNQIKKGISEAELKESKLSLINSYEDAIASLDSLETSDILSTMMDHNFDKYKFISLNDYYKKSIETINSITVEDINKYISNLFTSNEKYNLYLGYKKLNIEDIKKAKEKGLNTPVEKYNRDSSQGLIITKEINSGSILKEEYDKNLDFHTLTLSNGSKVYLKKIDYQKDYVEFNAISKGGNSYISDKDIPTSNFLDIVLSSGPGSMTKNEYDRYLLSKPSMFLTYYVSAFSEGFSGKSNSKEVDELLKNFYGFVTEPKIDENVLSINKNNVIEYLKNRKNSKDTEFWDEYVKEYYLQNPRYFPLTEEKVKEVNSDNILNLYKDRLGNGNNFDYYIVGDFDYNQVKESITKYLTAIDTSKQEDYKILPEKIRDTNATLEKNLSLDKNSKVILYFGKKTTLNKDEKYLNFMAEKALSTEMLEILREKMSGVYSLNVNINTSEFYLDRGEIGIVFTCKPERVQELIKAAKEVVNNVANGKINDETISYLKKSYRTNYEREYKKNSYFNEYFSNIILGKEQTISPDEYDKMVSKNNISSFIKNIYGDYETTFILNPETKE